MYPQNYSPYPQTPMIQTQPQYPQYIPQSQPMYVPQHQPYMAQPIMNQPIMTQPMMTQPMMTQPMMSYPQQVVHTGMPVYNQQVMPMTGMKFNPGCYKCHGSGFSKKKGKPCKTCYLSSGMCYKCGGRGFTKKGQACKVCYYRKHGGNCPLCFSKKMVYGKNKPCKLCKFVQKRTFY